MKIVLTSIGSRGDVQPVVALGLALRRAGHEALLAAPEEFRQLAASQSLPFRPVGSGVVRLTQGQMLPRNAAGGIFAAWETFRFTLGHVLAETADDTLAACTGADVVVASGFHFLASSVAERVRARYAYAALTPISLRSAWYPPLPLAHLRSGPRLNRVGWQVAEQLANGALKPALDAARKRLGLPRTRGVLDAVIRDHPVLLAFSQHVAPPAPDWEPRHQQTGYWFLDEPFTPPEPLLQFLEAGAAPVYLGFGSMTKHDPLRTLRLILDASRLAGTRLLLGGEWSGLGGAQRAGDMAYICGDVPHEWLFPRVAAVVHHGGAGTTAAGLRAGRPSLLVPHIGDQFFWGRRIQQLGAGPAPIPLHQLAVERLSTRLREVSDGSYAQPTANLSALIRAEAGLNAAVRVIERL